VTTKPPCFCGGDGKYVDHNCGANFFVQCPHCLGTGQKKCDCGEVSAVCKKFGRGQEIVESRGRNDDDEFDYDDPHWMFID
jgi:hypothetical protein